jgi:hypothetical protein
MSERVVKVSFRGVVQYLPSEEWDRRSPRQQSTYQIIDDAMTSDEADAEIRRQAEDAGVADLGPWVVYRMTVRGKVAAVNAVCGQAEWAAIERAQPGARTLLRGGIASEGEAEQVARRMTSPP